jgi:integrase
MTTIKLRYVQTFRDRHGKVRRYYRRPGHPQMRLPGEPGSREFMEAYQAASEATRTDHSVRSASGSIAALLIAYYQSAEWAALEPGTQQNYRRILERFRQRYADRPAAQLQPHHLSTLLDSMANRPSAANNLLKTLRGLFRFAVKRGFIARNPTQGVDRLKSKGSGFRAWTDGDIAKFEAHWPTGSRARLALYLLLYTGQRRSDVVRLGWQHVTGEDIHLTQGKTGVSLVIPIHEKLKDELRSNPRTDLSFLMTAYGRPMTDKGFGKWFSDCAAKAGLPPHSSPHGLRKAAARWLAEAGCTHHEIASITGHTSLKEVQRYTKGADQIRLARVAMARLKG